MPSIHRLLSNLLALFVILGNNHDSLILEGLEYGSNDSQSTPSIRVRFVMMRDNKGNWKTVSKEVRGYQRD